MGKISNYTRALVAKLQDVFVVDQTDNNVTTTKSVTVEQIGDTIAGTQVHSDLKTDNQTIIGGINELAKDKNIADEYDDTHTYNTGDVTIYGNTLYICTTNNTTGTFDPSNWTATTIDNVIGSLSSLTTTDTSSLVGAVNEKATIVDLGRLDNATKTITFTSTVRFVVFSFGGSDSRFGGYVCFGRATTSFAQPLLSSSVVTVTPNNDTIAISTSTTNVYVGLVILSGSPDDFTIT